MKCLVKPVVAEGCSCKENCKAHFEEWLGLKKCFGTNPHLLASVRAKTLEKSTKNFIDEFAF